MTLEQVLTRLQQRVSTLKAQVADQSGLADAVRAINILATAQGNKDTRSLIDVKGLGRPKEFSCRRRWMHSSLRDPGGLRLMLECSAEQAAETQRNSSILNSCRLRRNRREEDKTWNSCCSRCIQHSWLLRVMRQITLPPTLGRIRWVYGEDCRNVLI